MVTPGKLTRRAALFEQLAAMISAGVSLTQAMEMVSRNRSTGIPRKILQELTLRLQQGHTFCDAMLLTSGQKREPGVSARHAKDYWLSDFDMALLSTGEESGRLDISFKTLARYYHSRAKIIRDTISSLILTIVTLHVFLLVFPIGLWQSFGVGAINGNYGQCLPFILEKIEVFVPLYGAVWFLAFACQGNRGENWRSGVEAIFSVIPGLGSALKYLVVARLAMALGALVGAGVPIIRAWELSSVAGGSPGLKREISKWTPQLELGTTPAEMVAQIPYFPDMFMQLYQTGEISGKQDETLERLQTYFETEGLRKLQFFCRMLNFIVYFGMAILVGIFVVRFYLGYWNTVLNSF